MLGRRRLFMDGLETISSSFNQLDTDEVTLVPVSNKASAAVAQHRKSIDGQRRINVLLAIGAFLIVFSNFLGIFTGKSMTTLATEQAADTVAKARMIAFWVANSCASFVWPVLCGAAVTIFAWSIVYFDSDRPGISPPSPLSPKKNFRYRSHNQRTCHLNYAMSLACGVVVAALLYMSTIYVKCI